MIKFYYTPLMANLFDHTWDELKEVLADASRPAFRVRQVMEGLYHSKAVDFDGISTLPKDVKEALKSVHRFFTLTEERSEESRTSAACKFLFRLQDGQYVESVALPNSQGRFTLCISTQVGCSLKCGFCASGLSGFVRDLFAHEIVEQAVFIKKKGFPVTNIVFMGMGEPLLNYDHVMKSVLIINDPRLVNIGMRHITISTAGVIEGIGKLAGTGFQARLSVSLHFPDEKMRERFMPVSVSNPLSGLMKALRDYQAGTGRQIMFEYILFKGLNESVRAAGDLIRLLKGLDCKVNLIPYNPVEAFDLEPPDSAAVKAFQEILLKHGIRVTLRRRRGEDIRAACGQLRLHRMENNK